MLSHDTKSKTYKGQSVPKNLIVYDLSEAAEILRVHPETIRKYCREKRIDSINISKSETKPIYRVTPDAIEKFLKQKIAKRNK